MKVLYVITRSDWGGAQVHLFDLVTEMIKKDVQCEVVVGEKGELYDRLQEIGVKVYFLPALVHPIRPLTDLKAIFQLNRLIKRVLPDIVHLHSTKAGWIGRISSYLAKTKVIFTAHGWCFTEGVSSIRKKMGIFIEKKLSNITHKIICVSDYDKQLALKYGVTIDSKIKVVYNGVSNLQQYDKLPEFSGDEALKVIMVARFSEPKDQISLIKAIPYIDDNIKIYFAGEGSTMSVAQDLVAEIDVTDQVIFLGQRTDVKELLSSFDVFVLSSKYEGLPISIIEAMSVRLPIIASNVGGVKELVFDGVNGLLFDADDHKELAEKISALQDEKLRITMGAASQEIYQQKFTLAQSLESTYQIYQELN